MKQLKWRKRIELNEGPNGIQLTGVYQETADCMHYNILTIDMINESFTFVRIKYQAVMMCDSDFLLQRAIHLCLHFIPTFVATRHSFSFVCH